MNLCPYFPHFYYLMNFCMTSLQVILFMIYGFHKNQDTEIFTSLHLFIHSFIRSFIHSFIHSSVRSFVHSFVCSFVLLFVIRHFNSLFQSHNAIKYFLFQFPYFLISFTASSSCSRFLPPRLPFTSIIPSIFLPITCPRRQFLRKM